MDKAWYNQGREGEDESKEYPDAIPKRRREPSGSESLGKLEAESGSTVGR